MHCACEKATRKRKRERAVRVREARTDSTRGPQFLGAFTDQGNAGRRSKHTYSLVSQLWISTDEFLCACAVIVLW